MLIVTVALQLQLDSDERRAPAASQGATPTCFHRRRCAVVAVGTLACRTCATAPWQLALFSAARHEQAANLATAEVWKERAVGERGRDRRGTPLCAGRRRICTARRRAVWPSATLLGLLSTAKVPAPEASASERHLDAQGRRIRGRGAAARADARAQPPDGGPICMHAGPARVPSA